MTDLIARLEAATEGSRELDLEIACMLDVEYRKIGGTPPHYTTSVDVALTLVPEGWDWQLSHYDLPMAVLGPRQAPDHDPVEAHTPALALCIAALKSRSAS